MHVSYGLPTHRVDREDEFLAPGAVGELARAAEAAGFAAVYTTDHPFPGDAWLAHGATTPSTRWWPFPLLPRPPRRSASTPTCSSWPTATRSSPPRGSPRSTS